MHGGPLILLRQSVEQMRYAKPWQQTLFALGLLALGITMLVVLQQPIGIGPAVLGGTFSRRAARNVIHTSRSQRARRTHESGASSKPPQ